MQGDSKCINYACKSGNDMIVAPKLCLSYYRVKQHKRTCFVCKDCYNSAMMFYDNMADCLISGKELAEIDIPFRNDLLEVDDSDEEEQPMKEDESLSMTDMQYVEDNMDDFISQAILKYNVKEQYNAIGTKLNEDIVKLERKFQNLSFDIFNFRDKIKCQQLCLFCRRHTREHCRD